MKRTITAGASIVAIAFVGWLCLKAMELHGHKREAEVARATMPELGLLPLVRIDGLDPGPVRRDVPNVVLFFATWCRYCHVEIEALASSSLMGANVLLVSAEDVEVLAAFGRSMHLGNLSNLRILQDTAGVLSRTFRIRSVPTAFVYSRTGRLIDSFEGLTHADRIAAAVSRAGASSSSASTLQPGVKP